MLQRQQFDILILEAERGGKLRQDEAPSTLPRPPLTPCQEHAVLHLRSGRWPSIR